MFPQRRSIVVANHGRRHDTLVYLNTTKSFRCLHAPGPTGTQGHNVRWFDRLFVRSFVCYQSCEHNILKTNRLILMQIGTSDPRGKCMKRSTLTVRRSKFKAIQGRR